MLTIAQGVLVAGDLQLNEFTEGDQPTFTLRFDDLIPDDHSATVSVNNGPELPILAEAALNNTTKVFVENYFADGFGQVEFRQDGITQVDVRLYSSQSTVVGSFSHTVAVANASPELQLKTTTSLADTLTPIELQFDISDLGDDTPSSVTIDWGDGNQDEITDLSPAVVSHQYKTSGSFTIRAFVTDNDGAHPWTSLTTPIHVAAPNTFPATTDLQLNQDVEFVNGERFAGTVATMSNFQLSLHEYAATVFWADGHTLDGQHYPECRWIRVHQCRSHSSQLRQSRVSCRGDCRR